MEINLNNKIIRYKDLVANHSLGMIAGVALTYKILETISEIVNDHEFFPDYIYTGVGMNGMGIIDSFRYVFGEDVVIDTEYKNISCDVVKAPNGGDYYFEFLSDKIMIKISLLHNILPKEFYRLSRLAKLPGFSQDAELMKIRNEVAKILLNSEWISIFNIETLYLPQL